MTVRTRFAPSPTGYLHIGGVRTALFNWLFARRHGGQFILRIDDTDQKRNLQEALAPILHGFRWMGLNWDEGPEVGGLHEPYYQSQRLPLYQQAVQRLLDKGQAYYDYSTAEEYGAERDAAQQAKEPFFYSRTWMGDTPDKRAAFEAEGRKPTVRLKMPREGTVTVRDAIRGEVPFEWSREQDTVIQRADGTCTYHLASVVDDGMFQITHVIRAAEHFSNTPRQIFIAQGLGYDLPMYAHVPFVNEPGGNKKLSKRDIAKYLKNKDFNKLYEEGQAIAARIGLTVSAETFNPVLVEFYEQTGYLADALFNYLLLLGWSLDDQTEIMSRQTAIENFSLERVGKAPAKFDPVKLASFEDHYMQQLSIEAKAEMMLPFLQKAGLIADPPREAEQHRLTQVISACGNRLKVGGEILNHTYFFLDDGAFPYDQKAWQKGMGKTAAAENLSGFRQVLAQLESFDAETLETALQDFCAQRELKVGMLVHPVRVAVTGQTVGCGLYETLEILGKSASLARIDRALTLAEQNAKAE